MTSRENDVNEITFTQELSALRKLFGRTDFNFPYSDDPVARNEGRKQVDRAREAFTRFASRSTLHAIAASQAWENATDLITPPIGYVPRFQRPAAPSYRVAEMEGGENRGAAIKAELDFCREALKRVASGRLPSEDKATYSRMFRQNLEDAARAAIDEGDEFLIDAARNDDELALTIGRLGEKQLEAIQSSENGDRSRLYRQACAGFDIREKLAIGKNPDWEAAFDAHENAYDDYVAADAYQSDDEPRIASVRQLYFERLEQLMPFKEAFRLRERASNPGLLEWMDAERDYEDQLAALDLLQEGAARGGKPAAQIDQQAAENRIAAAKSVADAARWRLGPSIAHADDDLRLKASGIAPLGTRTSDAPEQPARSDRTAKGLLRQAMAEPIRDAVSDVRAAVAKMIEEIDVRLFDRDAPYYISEDSYVTRNEARDEQWFLTRLKKQLDAFETGRVVDLSRRVPDHGYDPEDAEMARLNGLPYVPWVSQEMSAHERHVARIADLLQQLEASGVTVDTGFTKVPTELNIEGEERRLSSRRMHEEVDDSSPSSDDDFSP